MKLKRGQLVNHAYVGMGIVLKEQNYEGCTSVLVYWFESRRSHNTRPFVVHTKPVARLVQQGALGQQASLPTQSTGDRE